MLMFLEYLVNLGNRSASLQNYLSVLRHYAKVYEFESSFLYNKKLDLFIKSVAMNAPYRPKLKPVFTIADLRNISIKCDEIPNGLVYRAIFLLAYFAFFRLSNLVPQSQFAFDITRHLTVGDVIFGPPGAHILVKWHKAMQSSQDLKVVQIPQLQDSYLCPVRALQLLYDRHNPQHLDPFFVVFTKLGHKVPIAAYRVRATLATILADLGLHDRNLGFHAYRRSGASFVFNQDVKLQNIQAHGGWQSDAIWSYLHNTPTAASQVAQTFKATLNTH